MTEETGECEVIQHFLDSMTRETFKSGVPILNADRVKPTTHEARQILRILVVTRLKMDYFLILGRPLTHTKENMKGKNILFIMKSLQFRIHLRLSSRDFNLQFYYPIVMVYFLAKWPWAVPFRHLT